MSVALLHKLQRYVLFALIISLPLTNIPKSVTISALGGNVSNYFFILGIVLLVYEYAKYRFDIDRKAILFISLYIVWQIICLANGLYFYEYNSMLTLEQMPKLQFVLDKLTGYGFTVEELFAIKLWLFVRMIKDILFLNNTVFLICFYIYHLYRDNFEQAFNDVFRAVTCLVMVMGAYSAIELLWLKLNLPIAQRFLEIVNPYLYDIKSSHGWWPPLLWAGQLRSIACEPSFFGLISIMCLPIVWSDVFKDSGNKFLGYVLIFYYTFMIAATNARTAIVVTGGELFLLIMSIIFIKNKAYIKKVITVLTITFIAFSSNILTSNMSVDDYIDNNVASVANTTSRSNNARFANLVANLNTIVEYPVMGVGTGLKDAYIDRNLPEFAADNHEVQNWSKYLHDKGVLKSGYPALNKYSDVAVQNGIIGLFLYLSVVLYLCLNIYRKWNIVKTDYRAMLLIIAMLGLLVAKFSNAGFVILNGIVWGMLYCKVSELKKEV